MDKADVVLSLDVEDQDVEWLDVEWLDVEPQGVEELPTLALRLVLQHNSTRSS